MPLHTKYRPTKLEEVIGNANTVLCLRTHLKKESPNKALLFTGPSGCGKSTLAYCVAREVIGGTEADFDWNFRKLNSADFRGIDTIRDIRDKAGTSALGQGENRVWLLEEAHKLSEDAKEALLDLLEHPPGNCWFLFTTTNPEKFKVTLKRRLTDFAVEPLKERELTSLLLRVLKKEGKRVPNNILDQICIDSMCSPGIALAVLDKIIDLPEEEMAKASKKEAARASTVITLCQELLKSAKGRGAKWPTFAKILEDLEEEDPESIRRRVLEYFRKVMLGGDRSVELIMLEFSGNYYDNGKAGLMLSVGACVKE